MRRVLLMLLAIVLVLLCASCNWTEKQIAQNDSNNLPEAQSETYIVTKREKAIYLTVYDNEHLPFEELGPFSKEPGVKQINERMILVELQAGTGKETKWGIFYDLADHRQSEVFYGILAEIDSTVAYCSEKKVIIQDVFNKEVLFQVVSDFPKELSPTATPFVSAEFTNDSEIICITYLSGSDYHEETISVALTRSN